MLVWRFGKPRLIIAVRKKTWRKSVLIIYDKGWIEIGASGAPSRIVLGR